MRKIAIFSALCIFISSLCLCTGCGRKSNVIEQENSAKVDTQTGTADASEQPGDMTDEEISKEGKTVVTWMVSSRHRVAPTGDEVYKELNKLLDKKGYDIYVEFYTPESDMDEYTNQIYEDVRDKEKKIDIFNIGYDYYSNLYADIARDGLCEDLTDYLQGTEGKKLYNIQDEMEWEAIKVDDKVYGISIKNVTDSNEPYFYVNEAIADKYGIDCERLLNDTIYLYDSILLVEEGEKENKDFVPYLNMMNRLYFVPDNVFMLYRPIGVMRDSEGKYTAVNMYELEEIRKSVITCHEMAERESMLIEPEKMQKHLDEGSFFIAISNSEKKCGTATEYSREAYITRKAGGMNCVSTFSENKEAAFELLAAIYTDRELSELLVFGIEGKHYKVENDTIYKITDSYAKHWGTSSLLANRQLLRPSDYEITVIEPLSKEYIESHEMSPLFKNPLDLRKVKRQMLDVIWAKAFYDGTDSWVFNHTEWGKSYEEMYEESLQVLKDAGVDAVLEEINRQLRERGMQ